MAHNQHERDLHTGRRQHKNHDHYHHKDRGGVSRGQKELAPQVHTANCKTEGERNGSPLLYVQIKFGRN